MVLPADSAAATAGAQPSDSGPVVHADDGAALDDLARSALGNDPVAVREFLSAIVPTIRRVCRGVMGREHPDLEDAVQDCLIETLRALPRFRFESSIVHYVTRICTRLAIATRRRTTLRAGRFPGLDEQRDATATWAGDEQAPREGPRGEEIELVRRIVRELSAVQAEAITLRILLEFSIEEIASITSAPINTVKTRLRLGKDLLRRRLESQGYLPSWVKGSPR